jgi:hypothetical protein
MVVNYDNFLLATDLADAYVTKVAGWPSTTTSSPGTPQDSRRDELTRQMWRGSTAYGGVIACPFR